MIKEDIINGINRKLTSVALGCNIVVFQPTYMEKHTRNANLVDLLNRETTKLAPFINDCEAKSKTSSVCVIVAFGLSGLIALLVGHLGGLRQVPTG